MNRNRNMAIKTSFLWSFLLLLTGVFFLTGCQLGLGKTKPTIILPEKTGISIEGSYTFDKISSLEGEEFIDESGFKNFGALFSLSEAKVGLEKLDNPSYMVKLVNTFDYFLEKYRINPGELGLTKDKMEVVTISTSGRHFYDVFKLGTEDIAIIKGSNLIKLRKVSGEEILNFNGGQGQFGASDEINNLRVTEPIAGVLIGLRGKRDGTTENASYRTLWITNDGEIQDVYEVDNILFPRKEFWTLKVVPAQGEENKETLEIKAITGNLKDVDKKTIQNYDGTALDITFVGNNYLSVLIKENKTDLEEKALNTMTIAMNAENLFTPVSIFDVGGEEGESAFILSLEEALGRDEFSKIDPISLSNFKQSFILNRHHGNWRLKSSLEYNDEKISVPIAYKPSKDLVVYDELPLNWSEIKQRVPQAKDAFWAPGNSFLLVKTSKYLMIYGITEKGLTDSPLQRVEIDENEEIIMAEWARGDFVSRWTTVVSKIGQRIIFVQN